MVQQEVQLTNIANRYKDYEAVERYDFPHREGTRHCKEDIKKKHKQFFTRTSCIYFWIFFSFIRNLLFILSYFYVWILKLTQRKPMRNRTCTWWATTLDYGIRLTWYFCKSGHDLFRAEYVPKWHIADIDALVDRHSRDVNSTLRPEKLKSISFI